MMTNISDALKELYGLYKKDAKTDTQRASLFRVRTGIKCGSDWYMEGDRECQDFCKPYGKVGDLNCECGCY